jgi:hypothetical protein
MGQAGGKFSRSIAIAPMGPGRRANGAGSLYIKHGSYYGRWVTADGGHVNRRLGPVRRPGTRQGLTHTQAEQRRQGELLAVRWHDLDFGSHRVRVRRAFVCGEFKAPKSVRGVLGCRSRSSSRSRSYG